MNNRKINKLNTFLVLALMLMVSCSKSALDTKPSTQFAEQDVWSDASLVQLNLNSLYGGIPAGFGLTANICDESRPSSGADVNMANMLLSPDNSGWGNWNGHFKNIRACNVFLENVSKLPATTALFDGVTVNNRYKGEAIFLRAYYYQLLINYFGGVPLIKTSYKLTDSFSIARSSYADCVKFITDECDAAAALLPSVNTGVNNGRATKGAALALKARVLLYAASDLHNSSTFSSSAHPELVGYTDANRSQRWQAAKDASKAVIDLGIYSLFNPAPASGNEATINYQKYFTSIQGTEDIYVRFFNVSANQGANYWVVVPNGFGGIEAVGGTSELVDAFEMSDGTTFSRTNPDQNLQPYLNRDPRFYASLLYEGAIFRPRPSSYATIDPIGVLQAGTWEVWDAASNSVKLKFGLDSRNSALYGGGYNNTGTSMFKFVNPKTDMFVNQSADLTWRMMRYSEVILNYAEACIELGLDAEARTYVNMIRTRAGMPNFTESGAALKARYQNERRTELIYEDHRFFDVRRWMKGSDAYHDIHGVDIVYKCDPVTHVTATIPTITPTTIMTGSWNDKAYFMPISRDEMNKNKKLFNNPGYN
jgi:hypothetical protein